MVFLDSPGYPILGVLAKKLTTPARRDSFPKSLDLFSRKAVLIFKFVHQQIVKLRKNLLTQILPFFGKTLVERKERLSP